MPVVDVQCSQPSAMFAEEVAYRAKLIRSNTLSEIKLEDAVKEMSPRTESKFCQKMRRELDGTKRCRIMCLRGASVPPAAPRGVFSKHCGIGQWMGKKVGTSSSHCLCLNVRVECLHAIAELHGNSGTKGCFLALLSVY